MHQTSTNVAQSSRRGIIISRTVWSEQLELECMKHSTTLCNIRWLHPFTQIVN